MSVQGQWVLEGLLGAAGCGERGWCWRWWVTAGRNRRGNSGVTAYLSGGFAWQRWRLRSQLHLVYWPVATLSLGEPMHYCDTRHFSASPTSPNSHVRSVHCSGGGGRGAVGVGGGRRRRSGPVRRGCALERAAHVPQHRAEGGQPGAGPGRVERAEQVLQVGQRLACR